MMRKILCVIPLLFLAIQPYTQTNNVQNKTEDKFVIKIEEDTIVLSEHSEKLIEETKELDKLEQRENELRKELIKLNNKIKQKAKDDKELKVLKETLDKYNQRGI